MPISPISAQFTARKNQSPSFGFAEGNATASNPPVTVLYDKPKDSFVKRAATNFVAGAVVSSLLNVGGNIIFKSGLSAKAIAAHAALCGVAFIVIDGIFNLMDKLLNPKK